MPLYNIQRHCHLRTYNSQIDWSIFRLGQFSVLQSFSCVGLEHKVKGIVEENGFQDVELVRALWRY